MALAEVDVVVPTSADEAVAAFGDGQDVTVIAGGTIVMPELVAGRLRPKKALLLGRAGLDGIRRANGKVTIGATTPVSALEDGDEPLATAARHVGDLEVRSQATVGGNLCSAASVDAPRGDLQAALLVLGATVRSAGKGGERTEPIESFLASGAGRLVLDISYDDVPRKTGYAAAYRPHAHHYTILAVAAARDDTGLHVAATGLGPQAVRLTALEEGDSGQPSLKIPGWRTGMTTPGGSGRKADAEEAVAGLELHDDALASAWYRARLLPRLVERALADLGEGAR